MENIEKPYKNVSYLRARDPSILTCAWNLGNVRQNLALKLTEDTEAEYLDESQDMCNEEKGHLQVYLRIKQAPNFQSLYEIENDQTLLCKVPPGAHCSRNVRDGQLVTKVFKFSKIIGPDSSQLELFNDVVKAKVLRFINGTNCSLLTYGASGSGKTFTIIGTPQQPGIVPQTLEYLFRTLPKLPEYPRYKPCTGGSVERLTESDCKRARRECLHLINILTPNSERFHHAEMYRAMQARLSEERVAVIIEDISHVNLSIWVSFAEIYNEHVFDLLNGDTASGTQRQKLRVVQYPGGAYIKGLMHINVSSGLEAYHVLQYGLRNLNYAATTLNDHSSRSHSIFSIKLAQASETKEGINVSCFNFCDLAGSERMKKTNHVGDRLKESNNINTSLLVLGRCMSLVRDSQKRNCSIPIPFRESKLTQLFQRALQGLELISMIVNINPTRDMFDESQHVLNFSAVAKDVILEKQQPVTKRVSNSRLLREEYDSLEKQKLIDQIETLYDEIIQIKLDHEEDQQNLITSYKKIIDDNSQRWEKRCKELQEMLSNRIRTKSDYQESNKKRKLSIVNLVSSDEEDNTVQKNKKDEITALKCELQEQSRYKERCQDVENQNQKLNLENFKLKEQINELNDYIEAIQRLQTNETEENDCNSNTHEEFIPDEKET